MVPTYDKSFKAHATLYFVSLLVVLSFFYILHGSSSAFAVESFVRPELPNGISYEDWIAKYWTWWVTTTHDQINPSLVQCIMHRSDSMIMLMEANKVIAPDQECTISSKDAIMIPFWTAWYEDSEEPIGDKSFKQLTELAKTNLDNGQVNSKLTVDNLLVAELSENTVSGNINSTYSLNRNVVEIFSTGFNITIPEDSHTMPDQNVGTWPSGAHGWFALLKPLPKGDHKVHYTTEVGGESDSPGAADITYLFHVE